jgi:hypothetical protein
MGAIRCTNIKCCNSNFHRLFPFLLLIILSRYKVGKLRVVIVHVNI